ncbi:MAG: ATP-binding protein, partial [Gemmatimonadota bacterium]|nr:ATP-binding protein [Gemmatimonadota bacterium]
PADALWTVRADPTQINQVLTNLCANARDAMARAGRIEVRTANVLVDAQVAGAHADVVPGEFVAVAVQDTGCGMDAQTVAHIFEPFFTTKQEGQGTGLGLSTVYGVAHQNGGFVTVESAVGAGTTITVFLPRDYGRAAGNEGDASAPVGGAEAVLLVEDEEVVLQVTTRMLEALGYTVLATSQPMEAADLMRGAEGTVCLALLDVVMPKLTGVEVAARLRELNPALPCLFMSAYPSDIVNNRGLLEPGMHFLQKPFTSHELAARVRASMGGVSGH